MSGIPSILAETPTLVGHPQSTEWAPEKAAIPRKLHGAPRYLHWHSAPWAVSALQTPENRGGILKKYLGIRHFVSNTCKHP